MTKIEYFVVPMSLVKYQVKEHKDLFTIISLLMYIYNGYIKNK
jgi:hypothetical protein